MLDRRDDLVVCSVLDAGEGRLPDESMVLRAFDGLRRRLALQVDGQAGIGLGYDVLDISWARLREVGPTSRVSLAAALLTRRPGRHEVEYVARLSPGKGGHADPSVVVRARGWTLIPQHTEVEDRPFMARTET